MLTQCQSILLEMLQTSKCLFHKEKHFPNRDAMEECQLEETEDHLIVYVQTHVPIQKDADRDQGGNNQCFIALHPQF
eukprot:c46528_g1_i1 orf=100-330(+)